MASDSEGTRGNQTWQDLVFIVVKIAAVGFVTLGGAWIVYKVANGLEQDGSLRLEVVLPIVVVYGVVSLLLTLGVLVSILAQHNIIRFDSTGVGADAFGLPEGSMQAAIALILLLVFIITALFVASAGTAESIKTALEEQPTAAPAPTEPLASPTPETPVAPTAVSTALATESPTLDSTMTGGVQGATVIGPASLPPAGSVSESPTIAPTETPVPVSTPPAIAGNRQPIDKDIAIQLITTVGTLATAVSSFYFGSRIAAGRRDSAAGNSATPPGAT